jgi:hypothetical protein
MRILHILHTVRKRADTVTHACHGTSEYYSLYCALPKAAKLHVRINSESRFRRLPYCLTERFERTGWNCFGRAEAGDGGRFGFSWWGGEDDVLSLGV